MNNIAPLSRRTQRRKILMRLVEEETYTHLVAEWRASLAERELPGDLVLEARDKARRRFDRYVEGR